MTAITFPFSGYPGLVSGEPMRLRGTAEVELMETPRLPICADGQLTIPERPLQRPMRWRIRRIALTDVQVGDVDDLCRWVQGRFWACIPRMLYAEVLAERGLAEHAETYRSFDR